jgi:hypothetical protein
MWGLRCANLGALRNSTQQDLPLLRAFLSMVLSPVVSD